MKVIDNFLPLEEFEPVQQLMLSSDFPWYYNPYITYSNENSDEFQFTHCFYRASMGSVIGGLQTGFPQVIELFLKKLDMRSIVQIKANMNPRTETLRKFQFHVDCNLNCNTAIFYINSNDGYTEFENGDRIESIANRLVLFDSNLAHRGTSCTNSKVRVLLNLNYF